MTRKMLLAFPFLWQASASTQSFARVPSQSFAVSETWDVQAAQLNPTIAVINGSFMLTA